MDHLNHVQSIRTLRSLGHLNVTVVLDLIIRIIIVFLVQYILTKVFIRVGSLLLWFSMINYLIRHLRKHGDLRLVKDAIGHLTLIN